ncbi:MAG: alpha/beta fold hydrolase [Deltaproteobacteria bacterium]|nr:alpha/beta fold hydrolase [Deltaproteobacteria bacterium]
MTYVDLFQPATYLKGPYVQTILASNRARAWGKNPMVKTAREMIIDAGDGIRLQGFFSPQTNAEPKGLVILLHGWEGSAESSYVLGTGRYLYTHGYAVFRLNFRDHGESHHLNKGLFFASLLGEVFNAVRRVSLLVEDVPVFLVGFSLGGNFALRISKRCSEDHIENLMHVVAISPVLDPDKSTRVLDSNWFFRWYFLNKWRQSLKKKQTLFPEIYDFTEVLSINTCRGVTEALISRYSPYKGIKDYFERYTITGDALGYLHLPTTIITSKDDPLIPVEDFYQLKLGDTTNLLINSYGGHNGFIERLPNTFWYERKLFEIFEKF